MNTLSINMNKVIKFLLFLIMALPGCCIIISNIRLRFSITIFIIFSFFYALIKYKKCLSDIIIFFKNPTIKILLLWIIWCFFSGLINCILGSYKWNRFLFYFIYHIMLSVIPCYLGFILIHKNSIQDICRFYYKYVFWMLILGVINYIFIHSGITFLQTFFDVYLVNTRSLFEENFLNLTRTKSVFVEPSFFADFICFNLPLIYEFSKNQFKIIKSPLLNIILKKGMVILAWLMIIATKSPIFLIFSILVTIIYFFITSKKYFKLIFIFLTSFILLIATIILPNINFHGTYIERIINVVENISDFKAFIYVESSLATRIVSICNQFILALKNPIIGIGYGNITTHIANQLYESPLPLTPQLITSLRMEGVANIFLFWTILCETGFIGITLLYTYFITTIKKGIKLLKVLTGYEKAFISSCIFMLTYQIIIFLYDGEFAGCFSFILGIIAGINIYIIKQKRENNVK